MGKQLFKATVVVSTMTLISRLLGFVRDMLIARLFGVDLVTDAFFVAFKIPNLLRRLFTEGAFAHALVPIMANHEGDKFALRQFIGKTVGTLTAWTLLITLVAMVLAPLLILLLAPGFAWQGTQYELAVTLLRIMLPFGLCIVLVAFAGAVLNAHENYAVPALTPIILNISMIATALWLAPLMDIPITALAWGVFIAGVVQLLFQIPSLIRLGLLPKLTVKFNDPDVSRVIKRLLPAVFSASVTQINLLLDTLIASFLVSGSVSWLYYSDRLVEFPLGILGMGLATVILPNLSKNHASDDAAAFSATLDWGLRLVLLVGLPATIGLFVLAEPMLSTLFQYNEFTINDVHKAGQSLKAYSVGLLGYLFIKILVPGFTSRHDLKTPVRYGTVAMIASLVLNVVLVFPLAHAGLALATSLGALLNAALLLKKLSQDKAYQPVNGWLLFLVRVILASAVMAVCLCYFVDDNWWNQWGSADRVVNLLKWISIGCIVYVLTLTLSGLRLRHLTGTSDKIANF
ncbi:murein biosynthesis integral membrane protein MurJ [Methyloglobulus sp.]|uniref:murein biosynthesis integral membrane protein MurJ n=1 Tax=Methyloglobulus sp. TaxID=2518622 RepID=UPI0032B78FA5